MSTTPTPTRRPASRVVSANVGYRRAVGRSTSRGFARVDNLFSRRYAGSVIVNEGNARFFEPAPARNWTVGVAATPRSRAAGAAGCAFFGAEATREALPFPP